MQPMKSRLVVLILIFLPTALYAFDSILVGTKSMGLAGAVTANPPLTMAIHHNPAGLSQAREGLVYEQSFGLMSFDRKNQFTPDSSFEILGKNAQNDPIAHTTSANAQNCVYYPFYGQYHGDAQILPLPAGMTWRPQQSPWVFALGSYMPFMRGMQYPSNDPSRFQAHAYYSQHLIYLAPGISYQWSDRLSFGISAGMGQTAWGKTNTLRILNDRFAQSKSIPGVNIGPFDGLGDVKYNLRDDMAVSVNVGAMWRPFKRLQLGLTYRSAIRTDLDGDFEIHLSNDFMDLVQFCKDRPDIASEFNALELSHINRQYVSDTVSLEQLNWPDTLQMGILYEAKPSLSFMFDIHWTRWSVQDGYHLKFSQDNPLLTIRKALGISTGQTISYPLQMKDTLSYHLGLEWQIKESFKWRAGLSYHPQSVEDSHISLMNTPDLSYISTGFKWLWPNRWVVEQSLGFFTSSNKSIPSDSSVNLNDTDSNNCFLSPYAGQSVTTKVSGFVFSINLRMPLSRYTY